MQETRPWPLPAFAMTVLLSACAGATTEGARAPLPLADYPPAFQRRAAAELQALPPACPLHAPEAGCSALARMIEDYGELRARVRVGG